MGMEGMTDQELEQIEKAAEAATDMGEFVLLFREAVPKLVAEVRRLTEHNEKLAQHFESCNSTKLVSLSLDLATAREALENVRDNYDCDKDAHRYGTTCRCCSARAALAKLGKGEG